MTQNPIVILILSEDSVRSDWVETEANLARTLEDRPDRHVLCPIALDASWKSSGWPRVLRDQIEKYHVLDFSGWRSDEEMTRMFGLLVEGLDRFYQPES